MRKGKVIGGVIACALGLFQLLCASMASSYATQDDEVAILALTMVGIVFLIIGALLLIFGLKSNK